MRKVISSIAVLVIIFCITASCGRINRHIGIGESHKVLITKGEYPVDAIKQIIATTSGGNIEVIGDAEAKTTVEVYGSYRSSDSAEIVAKFNDFFDLNITRDNNILNVTATQKHNLKTGLFSNNFGVAAHFVIHVGQYVINTLKTSGGNISLSHVTGRLQKINTSGGNLNIDEIHGDVDGETSGGNIYLANISGENITLRTSGGNIAAENLNGKVNLETSGGNVTVTSGKGNFSLETSGGNVKARNIAGPLKMSTSGGNVDAENITGKFTGSTSGGHISTRFNSIDSDITLNNSGGGIDISIPKNAKVNLTLHSDAVRTNGLTNFSGSSTKESIEGTLNGGGPTIKAKSDGGLVTLTLQ